MTFTISHFHDTPLLVIVTLNLPRLDLAHANQLTAACQAIRDTAPWAAVLDVTGVEFLDSTCLGHLVSLRRDLGDHRLILCGLDEPLLTLFQICRMDEVFPMFAHRADALDFCRDAVRHA